MPWIAWGVAWLATGFAVAVGIYYTKNPNCLWALIFPASVGIRTGKHNNEEKDNE